MCWPTGEITQTGRGGSNPPDGQEVDSTVWFNWLEDGERERDGVVAIRRGKREPKNKRVTESEVKDLAAIVVWQ